MDPESLYVQLGRLIQTAPNLSAALPFPAATQQWLGRASALVEEVGDRADIVLMKTMVGSLGNRTTQFQAAHEIVAIVHRALAKAEMRAPIAAKGAFIPAGNAFDALAAISRTLSGAKRDVLLVDPYMDERALTDFARLMPEDVALRLLADEQSHKPSLRPAVERWKKQHGQKRPLVARLSAPRTLHDRLIIVDGSDVWILTQSLKDFAARSPASIVRADGDAATLKVAAYQTIWDTAASIG